jgi:hypothetical protein
MSAMPRLSGTTSGMIWLTKPNTLLHACSSGFMPAAVLTAFVLPGFASMYVYGTASKTNKFASLHSLLKNIWCMGL